jgi:hypothetical protein
VKTIIRPGSGLIFMKVGTHAKESLSDIIARKTREIEETGFAMWGYGGNTCHPRTMVQPFAEEFEERGEPIHLCMQEMESKHFAEQLRAREFSVDGLNWINMPNTINVLGSRFALKIKTLKAEKHSLLLTQTQVAVGNSKGRLGSKYIQGKVDKACLEVLDRPATNEDDKKEIAVGLVAELASPYAVFLRG